MGGFLNTADMIRISFFIGEEFETFILKHTGIIKIRPVE